MHIEIKAKHAGQPMTDVGHYITNYIVLILCFREGIWLYIAIYIINIYINNIYDYIIGI